MSTANEFVYLRQIGYIGSLADMRNAYFLDMINGKSSPFGSDLPADQGEFTTDPSRWSGGGSNIAPSTQQLLLTYFTAKRTESISGITLITSTQAAAATPTLVRMGVYDVAANGDLTLNSSTPNDTTLFAAINTTYQKNFSVSFSKVAGRRYAVGVLTVTAVAVPFFQGFWVTTQVAAMPGAASGSYARMNGSVTGQTDLPNSISAGSIGNTWMFPGMRLA